MFKKLLLCALAIAGLGTLVPQADAGGYRRYRSYDHDRYYDRHRYDDYDDCDRRRYREVRVIKRYYRPRYRHYHHDYCDVPRYYSHRPRVGLYFGF